MKVSIRNFKSIKHIEWEARRINLIVGEPNVGKSNILEALSLFGLGFDASEKQLKKLIRYEDMVEWFYDLDTDRIIEIEYGSNYIAHLSEADYNDFLHFSATQRPFNPVHRTREYFDKELGNLYRENKGLLREYMNQTLEPVGPLRSESKIRSHRLTKKYVFSGSSFDYKTSSVLKFPHGENLYSVLYRNKQLLQDVAAMFEPYGLMLVVDQVEKNLKIQRLQNGYALQLPYHLIADTLQRMIFYYAAIASNSNTTLLFEEPENHSYPGYIMEFANRVVDDENGNNFFITTHSPYFLNTILAEADPKDVTLSVAYYEDDQTKLRTLTEPEIRDLLDYGKDLFISLDQYTRSPDAVQ